MSQPTKQEKGNEESNGSLWRHVGTATELGASLLAPAIVGWLLGAFLDNKFNITPTLTITLLIFGILAGLKSLLKAISNK